MIVENDYLPLNSELLQKLNNRDMWIELAKESSKENYRWWRGKSDPRNVWEELIKHIWGHINLDDIAGFEYWANICSSNNELDWHQDKDEKLYMDHKITVSPKVSTVYYGFESEFEGGFLEIALQGEMSPKKMTERIFPLFNRIVIFDPSRWHRVTPIESGHRFGFQVNIWHNAPSWAPEDKKDGTYSLI